MELSALEELTRENATHIAVMNTEMGELRDEMREVKRSMLELVVGHAKMQTDVEWTKRAGYAAAGSSIGVLITILLSVLYRG